MRARRARASNEPAHLRARLLRAAAAGRRAQEDVLEQAVARLELEDPLEEAGEREPAVGLLRRPPRASAANSPMRRSKTASTSASRVAKWR